MKYNTIPNPTTAPLIVGQRIRFRWKEGVIYQITGEQRPETVPIPDGGTMVTGGNALISIVFANGGKAQQLNEAFVRRQPWRIYDAIATQNEINEALLFAEVEDICANEDRKLKNEFEEVIRLRALIDNPHLERATKKNPRSAVLAARNIRFELKGAFPGTKFGVRSQDGSPVYVRWTLGPTVMEVRAIIDKYMARYSDDFCKRETGWAFTNMYGGTRLIFTTRNPDSGVEVARAA